FSCLPGFAALLLLLLDLLTAQNPTSSSERWVKLADLGLNACADFLFLVFASAFFLSRSFSFNFAFSASLTRFSFPSSSKSLLRRFFFFSTPRTKSVVASVRLRILVTFSSTRLDLSSYVHDTSARTAECNCCCCWLCCCWAPIVESDKSG